MALAGPRFRASGCEPRRLGAAGREDQRRLPSRFRCLLTPTFTAGGSKARGTATEGPQAIAGWDWGSDGGGSNGGAGIVAAPAFGAGAGGGGGEACVSLKARKGGPSKTRPRRRWRGHAAPNVFDTRLRRRFPHAVDCSEPTEVQRGPNNHHRGAHPRHLGCTYCIPNASTSSIDTSPRSPSSGDFAKRKDLAARESPLVSRRSGFTVVALYQKRGDTLEPPWPRQAQGVPRGG